MSTPMAATTMGSAPGPSIGLTHRTGSTGFAATAIPQGNGASPPAASDWNVPAACGAPGTAADRKSVV